MDIWLLIQIDFERAPMAVRIERAKVVFFVRVVGVAKVVEHCDGLDDAGDGFGAKSGDAGGHHRNPLGKILTQFIVQRADARSLAVHDGPPVFERKKSSGRCKAEAVKPAEARPQVWRRRWAGTSGQRRCGAGRTWGDAG